MRREKRVGINAGIEQPWSFPAMKAKRGWLPCLSIPQCSNQFASDETLSHHCSLGRLADVLFGFYRIKFGVENFQYCNSLIKTESARNRLLGSNPISTVAFCECLRCSRSAADDWGCGYGTQSRNRSKALK